MENMERYYSENTESVRTQATDKLNEVLKELHNSSTPTLLLLSGGSSLELLKDLDTEFLSPDVTVTVLDERYSKNPGENNMAQIMSAGLFYQRALNRGVQFIDTRVRDNESQKDLAKRFDTALKEWMADNPNGKIVATTGIGPDGHISGMMPYPEDEEKFKELFENNDSYVTPYDAGDKNPFPLRVTTNMNLMRKIDHAVVYAVGESKRDALRRFGSETGSLSETPSRILHELKNVYIFTDITT